MDNENTTEATNKQYIANKEAQDVSSRNRSVGMLGILMATENVNRRQSKRKETNHIAVSPWGNA
jgi:hypothetical protein